MTEIKTEGAEESSVKHESHIHSEAHKHHHHVKSSANNWKNAAIIFGILFAVSLIYNITNASGNTSGSNINPNEISAKTVDYLNKNVLNGQATAKIDSITEKAGLYNVQLDISGRKFDSYVTKDGKLLFPQAIDLEAPPAEQQAASQQPAQQGYPKTDKPNVKMFVMSFCPFGQQAENGLGPALATLGDTVELEPHFVIYSNYGGGGPNFCLDKENKYCSMHGIQELNEDVRQLCLWKYQKDKFWDYVNKINSEASSRDVDSKWEGIAKAVGVNVDKIKACQKDEALALLQKEVEANQKYDVSGSPSVFINDASHSGARTPESYKTAICSAFNTAPSSCGVALSNTGAVAAGGCGV